MIPVVLLSLAACKYGKEALLAYTDRKSVGLVTDEPIRRLHTG